MLKLYDQEKTPQKHDLKNTKFLKLFLTEI